MLIYLNEYNDGKTDRRGADSRIRIHHAGGCSVLLERAHRHPHGALFLPEGQHLGVWAEKSMYGRKYMGVLRTTFLIDAEGRIEHVFEKVDTKNHYRQIIDWLDK